MRIFHIHHNCQGFSFMEITGLEPAAYALRTHRYPSLAISPYKFIVAHWGQKARKILAERGKE